MHVTRTLRSSVLTKFEVLIKLVFQSGLRPRNRSRYRAASCRRRTWRPPPSTAAPGRVRAGTGRYRAWSLLVPRSPLSCRRPRGRQEQALRARDPRAFLTATRHVGEHSVRPGRKDGSVGPNKRIGRRAKRPFPPSWSPTHLSEEAIPCPLQPDNLAVRRLAELGWVEGQNIVFDCVSTVGRVDQVP